MTQQDYQQALSELKAERLKHAIYSVGDDITIEQAGNRWGGKICHVLLADSGCITYYYNKYTDKGELTKDVYGIWSEMTVTKVVRQ